MKHLFIINPAAGKGKSLSFADDIKNFFKDSPDNYIIEYTKYPGHATSLVKSYVSKDDYFVYSVGGDGTLNEVANALVHTNSILGVIPCGTGNDFIRNIVPKKKYKNILARTINGQVHTIDTVLANGKYFLNIASIGLDSNVVYNVRLFKKRFIPSSIAYLLSLFYTPFKYKSSIMDITIDDIHIHRRTLLIAVCNGTFYGGGVPISPKSSIEDNRLDICIVKDISLWKVLMCIPKVLKADHYNMEEIKFFTGNKISVSSSKEFILQSDGELSSCNTVNIEFFPKSLKILYPTN